jgi:hypothetical protein
VRYVEVSGKWRAFIRQGKKQVHLGVFNDDVTAALAYDAAAKQHLADKAVLNFPDGPPPGAKLPHENTSSKYNGEPRHQLTAWACAGANRGRGLPPSHPSHLFARLRCSPADRAVCLVCQAWRGTCCVASGVR